MEDAPDGVCVFGGGQVFGPAFEDGASHFAAFAADALSVDVFALGEV